MKDKKEILIDALNAAERQDYSGYSKFDALNSPFLSILSMNNKWLRLIFTQAVKELPFNIRPILKVRRSRNPKGVALFARAWFLLYQRTGDPEYLRRGESLVRWLLENPSPGQANLCWGYNFVWQNTIFLQDRFEPNAVVTIFVGEALIHAYRMTKKEEYLRAALSIKDFMLNDLPVLHDSEKERAISYVLRPVDAVFLNIQVLAGAFMAKLWNLTGEMALLNSAKRMIDYTVYRKTDYHAWYYTHPKGKSNKTHDNYHTGGILDGLLEYFEETEDNRYMETYWKGLEYYKRNLFEPDGAPKWMNNRKYPHDVHGAAQGIISFKKAARHDSDYLPHAEKVAAWTLQHLYREKTQDFAYRKGRWVRWNYSLMRWCNAWMARALAEMI